MTEREENSRILAEWLEPKPDYTPDKSSHSKMRAWVYVWGLPYPGDGGWKPADFYTDETANAMLLEKMPRPVLRRWEKSGNDPEMWACSPDNYKLATKLDPDRKAAICAAALLIARPA